MIRLHQFPPLWGLSSASSFCLKLETYLRMAGLDHEVAVETNPRKAPKGKLPYIEDGSTVVADSSMVIDYLKGAYGDPLDGSLTSEDRVGAHVLQRMIEESLYWTVLYSRWVDPDGWRVFGPALFGFLPWPLKAVVPGLVRAGVAKSLRAQGTGRHSRKEVYAMGAADIGALAGALGSKPYLTGGAPASVDASAFGLLAQILLAPIESPLKSHAQGFANLTGYCERIREKYYGTDG